MKKVLLKKIKIGRSVTFTCFLYRATTDSHNDSGLIELHIIARDVSATCLFNIKQWNNFIKAVNTANASFESCK